MVGIFRELRCRQGLSLNEFAKKYGFCKTWVQKIETEKIDFENLSVRNFRRLAKAYGIDMEMLYDEACFLDREI